MKGSLQKLRRRHNKSGSNNHNDSRSNKVIASVDDENNTSSSTFLDSPSFVLAGFADHEQQNKNNISMLSSLSERNDGSFITTENAEEEEEVPQLMMGDTKNSDNVATKNWRPWEKFLTRACAGFSMLFSFFFIIYRGHLYVCAFVALLQILLFRELVTVRYNAYFYIIEQNIPLFRTTQWMWFFLAIFYTYSDFALDVVMNNTSLHFLKPYAQLQGPFSFLLYAGTFVLTITTMQIGYIRFQLNQLCWTILVLCLIVGQVKYIMHNAYNGLIWFTLPILLVITNDVAAYFCGMTCGRKFIRRPFINLSPNKTWEGFIGGGLFTVLMSWYLSRQMAKHDWLTCPTNTIAFMPEKLTCELDPVFHEQNYQVPSQIFEVLPIFIVKMIPGIVDMCSTVAGTTKHVLITPCISGEPTHVHHHFDLIVSGVLPIQIHAVVLGMFASLVAPFGGYLASGIKRAYGVKDFDSIIPGHGGVMDRMDCQLIMALYTWVHYNTFVRITSVSVPKMLYMFNLMKESEQQQFYSQITANMTEKGMNI